VGNDHRHDFVWEMERVDRFLHLAKVVDTGFVEEMVSLGFADQKAVDLCFAPLPNGGHASREICPYGAMVQWSEPLRMSEGSLAWHQRCRNPWAIHICGCWRRSRDPQTRSAQLLFLPHDHHGWPWVPPSTKGPREKTLKHATQRPFR